MKHEVASRRRHAQAGVTLVEILVARAILGVLATAMQVHFDSSRPENQNVRLVSLKRSMAAMRLNNQWMHEPIGVVVDRVLWNGYLINMRHNLPRILDGSADDAELDEQLRQIDFGNDMLAVKQHQNISKGPIVKARQQVRARLHEHRFTAPTAIAAPE